MFTRPLRRTCHSITSALRPDANRSHVSSAATVSDLITILRDTHGSNEARRRSLALLRRFAYQEPSLGAELLETIRPVLSDKSTSPYLNSLDDFILQCSASERSESPSLEIIKHSAEVDSKGPRIADFFA